MSGGNIGLLPPAAVVKGFAPKLAAAAYNACWASTDDADGFFRWFVSPTESFKEAVVLPIGLLVDVDVVLLLTVVLLFLCWPGDGMVVVANGAMRPTNGVAPVLKGVNRGSSPTG